MNERFFSSSITRLCMVKQFIDFSKTSLDSGVSHAYLNSFSIVKNNSNKFNNLTSVHLFTSTA
jgi:tRNA A22 N-methylase